LAGQQWKERLAQMLSGPAPALPLSLLGQLVEAEAGFMEQQVAVEGSL
jgi:hypothetical protein